MYEISEYRIGLYMKSRFSDLKSKANKCLRGTVEVELRVRESRERYLQYRTE